MCVCVSLCTPSTNTCTDCNVCLCVALHTQYQHLYSMQCVSLCRSAHSVRTPVLTAMCVCVSLCTPSTNTCTHCNVFLCVALHTQYQELYSLQCVSVCRSAHPVPTAVLTVMCVCVSLCTPSTNTSTHYNVSAICISTTSVMFTNADAIFSMTDRWILLSDLASRIKYICLHSCFPITFSCLLWSQFLQSNLLKFKRSQSFETEMPLWCRRILRDCTVRWGWEIRYRKN